MCDARTVPQLQLGNYQLCVLLWNLILDKIHFLSIEEQNNNYNFLVLVFEPLAMSKNNSIPNYFLKLILAENIDLMDSRTHTESDGTTINPTFHVEFCCSSMSFYGACSYFFFLIKTIQMNCARSRCAASATVDIAGEFESLFRSVVKLSVFINYK